MKHRSPHKSSPTASNNEDKLKIIIRIRPILNEEDPNMFVRLENNDTLQIRRPGNHSFMKFNNILPPESTQKDVFQLVEDSVKQFLTGVNTTIFAYGQTGAGKTYSMIGNYSPTESQENLFNFLSSKERGVLSRSLEMIMAAMAKEPHCRIYVSFFEIYNEKIYDLYNNNLNSLDIRQSKTGDISIPDLANVQVTKMQEAIQFLMIGLKNRATGSTHANAKSSRSHSIFQISIEKQQHDQLVLSTLRIVDLAGSEKFKIPSDLSTAEKEIRIQELTSINGSLSSLGHCISALIEKSRTHIPFRNSKLTRILSDSLLGQGKMRFIICISPSATASAETFSTLQFANRAKKAIFERSEMRSPSMNKKKSSESEEILKRELQRQRQLRIHTEKLLFEIREDYQKLQHQFNKLTIKTKENSISAAQHHQKSKSIDKDTFSKISYYDQNKQNGFKEEMLKLTIFQKNKLNPSLALPHQNSKVSNVSKISGQNQQLLYQNQQLPYQNQQLSNQQLSNQQLSNQQLSNQQLSNQQLSHQNQQLPHHNQQQINNAMGVNANHRNSQKSIHSNASKTPYNKKKADFEKKIRKFIESDSPMKATGVGYSQHNAPNENDGQSEYSFQNNEQYSDSYKHIRPEDSQESHAKVMFNEIMNDTHKADESENLWDTQRDDSNQFIQKACHKMHLPEFNQLQTQMQRARQELINLRRKDNELEQRKTAIR